MCFLCTYDAHEALRLRLLLVLDAACWSVRATDLEAWTGGDIHRKEEHGSSSQLWRLALYTVVHLSALTIVYANTVDTSRS